MRLRTGHPTAAEVKSSQPGRRAWVVVDPLPVLMAGDQPRYVEGRSFHVEHYEVDAEHIGQEYEIPDSAFHYVAELTVEDEAKLLVLLESWGVALDSLTAPWRCQAPS